MEIVVPEGADARPPNASQAAPLSGTALRPTVWVRPEITPTLREGEDGVPPTDPYVLKFWTAAMGPGPVADLLRLVSAARRQTPLKRPLFLHVLVREGLVGRDDDGTVWVIDRVPFLAARQLRRLPPGLRAEHRHHLEVRRP